MACFLAQTIDLSAALSSISTRAALQRQKILNQQLCDALSEGESPEQIRAILDQGADPNATNDNDSPALRLPLWSKSSPAVIQTLILAGADLNARSRRGSTLLGAITSSYTYPVEGKRLTVLNMLIQAKADLNILEHAPIIGTSLTPLMWATHNYWHLRPCRSSRVIKLLIQAGADTTIKNQQGRTAKDMAAAYRTVSGELTAHKAFTQALAARNEATQKYIQEQYLKPSQKYLMQGALPIRPLIGMVEQYLVGPGVIPPICDPVERARKRAIEATEIQKKRAEATRARVLALREEEHQRTHASRKRAGNTLNSGQETNKRNKK
jgi:hypothetical protein